MGLVFPGLFLEGGMINQQKFALDHYLVVSTELKALAKKKLSEIINVTAPSLTLQSNLESANSGRN